MSAHMQPEAGPALGRAPDADSLEPKKRIASKKNTDRVEYDVVKI